MMVENSIPYFQLRVLAEYDSKHEFFVAFCLNTGSVVTADDMDTVVEMIQELLEDEVAHAFKFSNYGNLFSSPAPPEIWNRWLKVAKEQGTERMELRVKAEKVSLDDTETRSEVSLARTA